jgi:hypothetical protein
MMSRQARRSGLVMGLDTHMIAGSRACSTSTRPIHPTITNQTSPHYAEALPANGSLRVAVPSYSTKGPRPPLRHPSEGERGTGEEPPARHSGAAWRAPDGPPCLPRSFRSRRARRAAGPASAASRRSSARRRTREATLLRGLDGGLPGGHQPPTERLGLLRRDLGRLGRVRVYPRGRGFVVVLLRARDDLGQRGQRRPTSVGRMRHEPAGTPAHGASPTHRLAEAPPPTLGPAVRWPQGPPPVGRGDCGETRADSHPSRSARYSARSGAKSRPWPTPG